MITNLGDVMRQIQGGELRLLALGDNAGSPLFPQARPISDWVPGLEMAGWFGLCGPRAITADAARAWVEAIRKGLENPTFRQRLLDSGLTPNFEDMATFNRRIAGDLQSWAEVIRAAGVKAD